MYTLGTSAVKYLADNITDPAIKAALQDKIVAYVGTPYDKTPDAGDPFAPPAPSAFAVFFQLPAVGTSSLADKHTIGPVGELTVAQVFKVTNFQWDTTPVGTVNYAYIIEYLIPASSLNNVVYQFQRGNEADIGAAYANAGVPYFAKDKQDLWVHDGVKWVRVASNAIFIGTIIEYPEQLSIPVDMETRWKRCDGHTLTPQEVIDFPDFAVLIQNKFGTGYVMPAQNNAIIRVIK
jgi:hypothetical protein